MNVVLVAEEGAGVQALRCLTGTEHRVVGLLTSTLPAGKGASVASLAARLDIPVLSSELVRDASTADWLTSERVDLLLNVHSLHRVHPAVIAAPRIGSFNLHPGPLPAYAGLNAPSWAIYNGETSHAVTLHWMEAEIDTGPVAYSSSFAITERDTGLSVSTACVREGLPLLARLLEAAGAGPASIPAVAQNLAGGRYFGREVPDGGRITWSRPGRQLVDFVRACDYSPFASPWGHPVAKLRRDELTILKASRTHEPSEVEPGTVGLVEPGAVRVATADEWIRLHRVSIGDTTSDADRVLAAGDRLEDGGQPS